MYFLTSDSAVPIEIIYKTIKTEKSTTLEVDGINLYNGEHFDLSKLYG